MNTANRFTGWGFRLRPLHRLNGVGVGGNGGREQVLSDVALSHIRFIFRRNEGIVGKNCKSRIAPMYSMKHHLKQKLPKHPSQVKHDAKGVLGGTFVPTRDAHGNPIMKGMEAIHGKQEDCKCSRNGCGRRAASCRRKNCFELRQSVTRF